MNKNPRWLWLVFLPSVQLIILLLVILVLFNWLDSAADHAFRRQAIVDNTNSLQSFARNIDAEFFEAVRKKTVPENQLTERLNQFGFDNQHLVGIYDLSDETLYQLSGASLPVELPPLGQMRIAPIAYDSVAQSLNDPAHANSQMICGWLEDAGSHIFVTGIVLSNLNAAVVVAQPSTYVTTGLQNLVTRSRFYAFKSILLIGLVGIGISVIIVTRVGNTLNHLSDGLEKVVTESAGEILKTKNAVIFGLAKLAESRDNDTGEHLERIRFYVTILARELAQSKPDFDEEFIYDLGLASSLHDIGKVGIPDSILLKPGRLTPEERGIMEIHTLIGGECLDAIQARLGNNDFMSMARQIAYYHHERWDGTGYPHALKCDEIPLVARIVAVADVYDALTSKRPYKRAMTHEESRQIIIAGAGKHFDPEIVAAFLKHEDEFEAISIQQLQLTDDEATSNFQRLCETVAS